MAMTRMEPTSTKMELDKVGYQCGLFLTFSASEAMSAIRL